MHATDARFGWLLIETSTSPYVGALWWDKRKDTGASHWRGLRHDLTSLCLLKNDRLETWEGMLDVAEFDSWDAFPRVVLLWRSSLQTSTKHRNPIFSAITGIHPDTSLSVCWLHTLSQHTVPGVQRARCPQARRSQRVASRRNSEKTRGSRGP